MRHSKTVSCHDLLTNLEGRTITAVYSEYSLAALRLDGQGVIHFAVEEVSVGKWFEVFPISLYQPTSDYPIEWTELARPITVIASQKLWREEWLESSLNPSEHLGSGPHSTQYAAALGSAPESVAQVVKVLAGMKWTGREGGSVVVSSSDNTPFKIDVATDIARIEQIMQFHTCE